MILKAIVEIPKDSKYKYEISKESGHLVLDRVLNQAIPYNYGFFPNTLCEDGDPLDIFIVSNKPIPPLTEVNVHIIGGFTCKDREQQDDKLVGILVGDDVYPNILAIKQYLMTYKNNFKILDQVNIEEALKIYEESMLEWKKWYD